LIPWHQQRLRVCTYLVVAWHRRLLCSIRVDVVEKLRGFKRAAGLKSLLWLWLVISGAKERCAAPAAGLLCFVANGDGATQIPLYLLVVAAGHPAPNVLFVSPLLSLGRLQPEKAISLARGALRAISRLAQQERTSRLISLPRWSVQRASSWATTPCFSFYYYLPLIL
jgi:hypothetical protein